MIRPCSLLSLLLALMCSQPALAGDMEGPRVLGMGGALRAAAAGEAGAYINPAGLPVTKSYIVQALFSYRPQDNTTAVGVAISDSVTNAAGVSAALYYTFLNATPSLLPGLGSQEAEYTRRGHEAGMSVAYPLAERVLLGVTNKYIAIDSKADAGSLPGGRARGYTLDVGGIFRLSDAVSFAVVGQNLVPMKSWEAPQTLGAGVAFGAMRTLLLNADVVVRWVDYRDGEKMRTLVGVKAGGEYFVGQKFPFRLGYSWDVPFRSLAVRTDVKGESFFHVGLGLMSQQFGLEASCRQQVSGPAKETLLSFALKLFVQ